MKHKYLFAVWLLFSSVSAHADPAGDAFYQGAFYDARTLGQSTQSENGLMTACRAGMVVGGYFETGSAAVRSLHQAYEDCLKVVSMNPGHVNARITVAIITGFEGKRWQKPGLAKKSRRLLEALVAEYPDSAPAHAALGGWHSEVSAAGFLPKLYLGAKRSNARNYFSTATQKGEADFPFILEYLKFLARGDARERDLALAVARSIGEDKDLSAIDQMMIEKITALKDALISENKDTIKKAIADATAFQNIEDWRDLPPLDVSGVPEDDS